MHFVVFMSVFERDARGHCNNTEQQTNKQTLLIHWESCDLQFLISHIGGLAS